MAHDFMVVQVDRPGEGPSQAIARSREGKIVARLRDGKVRPVVLGAGAPIAPTSEGRRSGYCSNSNARSATARSKA